MGVKSSFKILLVPQYKIICVISSGGKKKEFLKQPMEARGELKEYGCECRTRWPRSRPRAARVKGGYPPALPEKVWFLLGMSEGFFRFLGGGAQGYLCSSLLWWDFSGERMFSAVLLRSFLLPGSLPSLEQMWELTPLRCWVSMSAFLFGLRTSRNVVGSSHTE